MGVAQTARVEAEGLKQDLAKVADAVRNWAIRGIDGVTKSVAAVTSRRPTARAAFSRYRDSFNELEQAVGLQARTDSAYLLRDRWAAVAHDVDGVVQAIRWEQAKFQAQELRTFRFEVLPEDQ